MVQNKTGTVSYKNHKQITKPQSEWIKVENTHEPLISQDVWDAVQRMDNHPGRGRTGKSGMIALFGGILMYGLRLIAAIHARLPQNDVGKRA